MHDDIREDNESGEVGSLKTADLFRDAHSILFARGVQMRLALAVLICVLFVFLPLILYSFILSVGGTETYDPENASIFDGLRYVFSTFIGFTLMVIAELFVVFPMFMSLPLMAAKAVRGEALSVSDVFAVFSKKHYRNSMWIPLTFVLLNALPIALFLSTVYGATTIYAVVRLNPSTAAFLPHVAVFCAVVCFVALVIAVFLSVPGYYFLALRVRKNEGNEAKRRSAVCAAYTVMRLGPAEYLRLRGRFLVLHLASLLTVCALYPIYTIPMYLIVTALTAERMQGEKDEA